MNKNKILITGGSGFIGTHLVKRLLDSENFDITVVDLMPPRVPGAHFVKSDISDLNTLKPYLKDVDVVVHLAAMIGVDNCDNNPKQVKKTNYSDTKKFIDLCIKNRVKRFIFASSSEVYGNCQEIPYREDIILNPISLYAKSKLKIEDYLRKKTSKMSVGIVRFFNVYGPLQKNNFVVSTFIEAALQNIDINIFGDGNQSRCFTYVEDAVEGVEKLIEYNKLPYEIINIGNPTETSIKDLAKTILECVSGSESKIVFKRYGGDVRGAHLEIARRVPSVIKAKELLGFTATTDLKSGIYNIINHYEKIGFTTKKSAVPAN